MIPERGPQKVFKQFLSCAINVLQNYKIAKLLNCENYLQNCKLANLQTCKIVKNATSAKLPHRAIATYSKMQNCKRVNKSKYAQNTNYATMENYKIVNICQN